MADFAQMPQNIGADNFRLGTGSRHSHHSLSQKLEIGAIAIPAVASNILGSSVKGASTLAAIPDVQKLHLPMIPQGLKTTMRSIIPPPRFAQAAANGGSAMGNVLAAVAKSALRLG